MFVIVWTLSKIIVNLYIAGARRQYVMQCITWISFSSALSTTTNYCKTSTTLSAQWPLRLLRRMKEL
jgi:hypothetical protein